jgi:[acyl-carrier-protein] S-malonyltransferase
MTKRRRVALLFPGQGSQYPRMAAGLYGKVDVFTETMDRAFTLFGDRAAELRQDWLSDKHTDRFNDVTTAQPLLYAVECALGRMVLGWGLHPVALLGHSIGEMVTATLAGVLDYDDGVRLIADRIEHYSASPPGGMLAVAASEAEVLPYLSGTLAVAAINAENQTMLAGAQPELTELTQTLRANGLTCMVVRANQAFHSPVVAAAAAASIPSWQAVRLSPPSDIPIYSTCTGAVLDPATAKDPLFWASHPATKVQFWPTLNTLLQNRADLLLIEVGPGQGLSTLARRHPAVRSGKAEVLALLPTPTSDRAMVRKAADRLAADGHISRTAVPAA